MDSSDYAVAWGYGVDAVQTVKCASATAGTYKLSLMDSTGEWVTTAAIAYNANIAAIDAAIELVLTGANSLVTAGLNAGAADDIIDGFIGFPGETQPGRIRAVNSRPG